MADLLEALLQIKALAGTPARLRRWLDPPSAGRWSRRPAPGKRSPAEILVHLAEAEEVFCLSARLIATSERPLLPTVGHGVPAGSEGTVASDPLGALERFASRRRVTCELLSACSAAQLERVGVHPVRKLVSLADLAAIMLAHDTDHVGQILEALDPGRSRERPPAWS